MASHRGQCSGGVAGIRESPRSGLPIHPAMVERPLMRVRRRAEESGSPMLCFLCSRRPGLHHHGTPLHTLNQGKSGGQGGALDTQHTV